MKRSGGKSGWWCTLAMVAAPIWTAALAQDAVTQVVPVGPPAASPTAFPTAISSPAANSPAPEAASSAMPGESPTASPAATGEITPALTGTAPAFTGTGVGPVLTGTAAATSGTGLVITATPPPPSPPNPYSIEIDLGDQRAYLLKDGKVFAKASISSGRAGHLTPTGNFSVIEKDLNHFSNLYGKIVEKSSGRVVKSGADVATPVPKGCKFVPAPMKWFLRFDGASGMHAGILPGYPASHGCVRMPAEKAELFYETVAMGTPVHVFGTPPLRAIHEEETPHGRSPTPQKATPTPAPQSKRGWWPF